MILIPAFLSCTTTPKKSESNTSNITFPTFPDPIDSNGASVVTYDDKTQTVSMPLWYWKKITRYSIDTEYAIDALGLGGETK